MYSKIRFLLAILFIVLGVVLHFTQGIGSAWYLYLGGIIMLLTHFLFGNVYQAFGQLKKGNLDEAETLIHQIKRPDWLIKNHRAYYYFVLGMIAMQRKQPTFGEQHLKAALQLGLRTETDNALAAINIAHGKFVRKEFAASNDYLNIAKTYKTDDLLIKEHLTKLEEALGNRLN